MWTINAWVFEEPHQPAELHLSMNLNFTFMYKGKVETHLQDGVLRYLTSFTSTNVKLRILLRFDPHLTVT